MSLFPQRRMRRLRRTPALRSMVRDVHLASSNFVMPVFVVENEPDAGPVSSMPGVQRHAIASLQAEIDAVAEAGIPAVLLFGVPKTKDERASAAVDPDGIVCRAIREIRRWQPQLAIITDVCVCSYTSHGHCGIVGDHEVLNDASVELLGRMAVAHAKAGADIVAPSAMLDGMVAGIRRALDDAGAENTAILSYAMKYASAFYGPFREAADSAPGFGDRRGYQMDPACARQALDEARLDIDEGADMLMVKPALPYLDIIRQTRDRFPEMPLAAYQVSGEYSMIKAAAAAGWVDEKAAVLETLTAIRRAGADMIISYYAKQAAKWIRS